MRECNERRASSAHRANAWKLLIYWTYFCLTNNFIAFWGFFLQIPNYFLYRNFSKPFFIVKRKEKNTKKNEFVSKSLDFVCN